MEKNSGLPAGDPDRKFKGRVVFEGCHVKDESNNWAIFSEIASCPATMEAGKACDAYGLFVGSDVQCADSEAAYTQALLGGTETWVTLLGERWPDAWSHDGPICKKPKYDRPVCELRLALYGHPDSGGFWEQHCEKCLAEVGFRPIDKKKHWRSVFWHGDLRLMLVVYVDDFKLAGPSNNLAKGWSLIGKKITMGEQGPVGRYLGCQHTIYQIKNMKSFEPRTA